MKLSAKMPAQRDSTLPAKAPAQMPSDSQQTGDGGSDDATPVACSQTTPKTVKWESINDNKPGWEATDGEWNMKSWETKDRNDDADQGAMPQRDPDGDGDLN